MPTDVFDEVTAGGGDVFDQVAPEKPAITAEQSAVAMDQVMRGSATMRQPRSSTDRLSIGAPPPKAPDLASQLVSEQRERRVAELPVGPVSPGPGATPEQVQRILPAPVRMAPGQKPGRMVTPAPTFTGPGATPLPANLQNDSEETARLRDAFNQAMVEKAKVPTGIAGIERVNEGMERYLGPSVYSDVPAEERKEGLAEASGGVLEATTPLMVGGAANAMRSLPTALKFARDMVAIYGASKAVEMTARKFGLSPATTAILANLVAMGAPVVAAKSINALEPRFDTLSGPGIKAAAGSVGRGKVGGFGAVTPDEFAAGVKVGPIEGAVRIPRKRPTVPVETQPALPPMTRAEAVEQLDDPANAVPPTPQNPHGWPEPESETEAILRGAPPEQEIIPPENKVPVENRASTIKRKAEQEKLAKALEGRGAAKEALEKQDVFDKVTADEQPTAVSSEEKPPTTGSHEAQGISPEKAGAATPATGGGGTVPEAIRPTAAVPGESQAPAGPSFNTPEFQAHKAAEDRYVAEARKQVGPDASLKEMMAKVAELKKAGGGSPAAGPSRPPEGYLPLTKDEQEALSNSLGREATPEDERLYRRTHKVASPEKKDVFDEVAQFKHRSTQADISPESEAGQAIETARQRISDSDLAGKGKDTGGGHVTVKYGLKDGSDIEPVKKYLASIAPFEASLGKTDVFPPSESSDGAAVVHAPIESPELHEINKEIAKHGEFAPSNFPDYKPHASLAYVKPERAGRYKGMTVTEGKKFKVDSIGITDREGKIEQVPLRGTAKSAGAGPSTKEAAPDSASTDPKQLADIVVSPAFKEHGLSGLDAPTQRVVMSGVITALKDLKVRKLVMGAVPVNVVDVLSGLEPSAKVSFHDKTVLKDLASSNLKGSVSLRVDTADSVIRAVASAVAELPRGTSKVGLDATQTSAALGAGDRPSHGETVTHKTSDVFDQDFALTPPPEDIGIKQYIDSLPKDQQDFARATWEWHQKGAADSGEMAPEQGDVPDEAAEAIDERLTRAAKQAIDTGSKISTGEQQNQPEGTARGSQDLPSVPGPESEGGNAPASVPPEGNRATEEGRDIEPSSRPADRERVERPARQPRTGQEPERGGGSGAPAHPATERAAGGTREARPTGADGRAVESPTPEEPEQAKETTAELRNQRNYRISDEYASMIGSGGEITKIKGNLDALETFKKIQAEGRELATPEEQEKIAKYVDFGGLVGMLQRHWESQYAAHYKRFTGLLTADEIQEIRETLPNTHYTSMQVVDWMWDALKRMGFRGGRILEPGMGIGNFFGRIPEKMAGRSELYGVERNPLTGGMTKLLYPDANIQVKPFQHFQIPNNSIDAVIGNVPFQDVTITDDPLYKDLKLNLHNYFIVKSLDKLRPGGIAALITSRYTMDGSKGTAYRAREEMAKRADLIAAIRLPDNAFKRTANTEVVADLLVFQKRDPSVTLDAMPDWTTTVPMKVGDREFILNKHFVDNPGSVIGEHSAAGSMYGPNQYTVKGPADFSKALEDAKELFPKSVFGKQKAAQTPAPHTMEPSELEFAPEDVKPGAFFRDEKGNIRIKQSGIAAKLPENLRSVDKLAHIGHAIDLRDQLNQTIATQLETSDDEPLKAAQKQLSKLYDAYAKKYGSLHGPKLKQVFGDDPEYPKLLALENIDTENKQVTKAAIFTKRVLAPYEPLRDMPDDPKSAMLKVVAERGYLDTKLMADLLKKDEADVISNLENEGLIYQDPHSGTYHTADDYLSGNVREKLRLAEQAAQTDKKYARNVEALQKAQPKPLTIHDIQPNLGQTWIPMNIYKGFVRHLANSNRLDVEISRDATGKWLVQADGNRNKLENAWSGGGISGHKLVQAALNQQQPTVWNKDSDGTRHLDAEKTTAAREKLAAIKEEFRTVLRRSTPEVTNKLEKIYNDTFNAFKLREFSGEHLDFPGMSEEWRGKIRGYQKSAVWRILQEGRAGIFHAPGLGKTLTMVAAGMEARRLKLSRKNMYAVPNHMVPQWREDFKRFYPNANVLAVNDDDFTATNRSRLMSRIATGDWDAVIVPHSQFDLLPMSPEWESKTIEKRLDDYRSVLEELDENDDKRTIKQIEKAVDKLESRLNELNSKAKDNTIAFDQLGVDMMFVDEAHAYKAMAVPSKMGNVGGLSNRASERAFALEMKADFMRDTHKGRGTIFATGTPITNTVGELYVMTKYLAPEMLEAAGIRSFDDWAANFATTITQWEYGADGVTFKPKTSLSEFVNVPELSTMFRRFAEYLSKADAKKLSSLKEPQVKRTDRMVKITPSQEPLLEMIADRGEYLTKHPPRTKEERQADNWLKLSGDARKISLDPRLYNPNLRDDPGSKANQAVKDIKDVLDRTAKEKGTVVVFSDFFQHKGPDDKPDFNLFEDMKRKLVKRGVPAEQLAIIHEAANKDEKEALFARVRSGKVRVLMGSTEKMGIGTNIQDRLKAELHLDQPWRPDQVEQREGRIERSGNMWDEVEIYRYIAEPEEGTVMRWDNEKQAEVEKPRPRAYDLQMYQQLARKANFQEQFLTGQYTGRTMEDTGGDVKLNSQMFQLAKAMATGNPDALKKIKIEHDLRTYSMLERNFQVEQSQNVRRQENLQMRIPIIEKKIQMLKRDAELWQKAEDNDAVNLKIGNTVRSGKELKEWLDTEPSIAELVDKPIQVAGIQSGIEELAGKKRDLDTGKWFDEIDYRYRIAGDLHAVPLNTIKSFLNSFASRARQLGPSHYVAIQDLRDAKEKLVSISEEVKRTSPYIDKIEKMEKEIAEINTRLGMTSPAEVDEGADQGEEEEKPAKRNSEAGFVKASALVPDKAIEALGAAADAMARTWEEYRNPPSWTDYDAMTRKWTGAEQASNIELAKFTAEIKKIVPEKGRREAISIWIESGSDPDVVQSWIEQLEDAPHGKDYAKVFEAALNLTPDELGVARWITEHNDQTLARAQEAGILDDGVENYVQHIWDKDPGGARKILAEINYRSLQINPSAAKKRTIPKYFDGIMLGFKPTDLDVGFLTAVHDQSFNEAIAARAYIKSLLKGKEQDGRPLATISRASAKEVPAREGDENDAYLIKPNMRPDEKFADYGNVDHPALRGWRWADDVDGKPVFVQGDLLIHPDIYHRVKNNLSKSAVQTWTARFGDTEVHPGRAVLRVSSELKHIILSFSGFHQTTLAVHALEHKISPVNVPEIDISKPDQRFLIDHGLMVADYSAMESFAEGLAGGGLVTKVPAIGPLYDQYRNYLFKSYLPRIKMAMAQAALGRNRERYGKLLSDDQIGRLTADQANAAFGHLNYKALGRNPTLQDVLRLTLLAPDFLEARARFVGQAGKEYGREQLMALVLGAVALYTLARLLNEMVDGDPHWDKPFSLVYNGQEYGFRTIQGDLLHLATDVRGFAMGRVNPLLRTGLELATGRDDRGQKRDVSATIEDYLRENVPIPAQAFTRKHSGGVAEKVLQTLLKTIGVNDKKYRTAAEVVADRIARDRVPAAAQTPQEEKQYRLNRELLSDLRQGKTESLRRALSEHKLTKPEAHELQKRAKHTELQDKVHGFSYEQTREVYNTPGISEREKKELLPILRMKQINRLRRHDPVDTE